MNQEQLNAQYSKIILEYPAIKEIVEVAEKIDADLGNVTRVKFTLYSLTQNKKMFAKTVKDQHKLYCQHAYDENPKLKSDFDRLVLNYLQEKRVSSIEINDAAIADLLKTNEKYKAVYEAYEEDEKEFFETFKHQTSYVISTHPELINEYIDTLHAVEFDMTDYTLLDKYFE